MKSVCTGATARRYTPPIMQLGDDTLDHLGHLGWRPGVAFSAALPDAPAGRVGRVSSQHRAGYEVAVDEDDVRHGVQPPPEWLRPRFPAEDRACVGDWVVLDAECANILQRLPRQSVLKRAAAGEHYKQQLIAANIDHVLVVCGLDHDFNPRRLERYLLLVRAGGSEPVIVLTKADQVDDLEPVAEALADIAAQDIAIHPVNAKDADSVRVLEPYLGAGRTVVLVGSSGAGKSTLTNTLLGLEKMATGEVREKDSRGRHTTTRRVLLPLPQGGCLIDTPGMRELKLTGEEKLEASAFSDVEAIAAGCRFRDCRHEGEPGCAVQEALDTDALDPDHVANYFKLRDELATASGQQAIRQAQRAEERTPGRGAGRTSAKRPGEWKGRR
nr:ribosome small subunit-dependent GTPase A [Alkalisalibacterium limincola]